MTDLAPPDRWDTAIAPLDTIRIGRPLWHYTSVPSTMPLAHTLADEGATDGTALIAEEQTAGRGRRGRQWSAPYGSALLCSLICRPPLRPEELFLLTAAVSVGLCNGVERATGLRPQVKWPNDLLLDGRKLAGVLCESRIGGSGLTHAVVGFGLNANLAAGDLPATPGAVPPTSLSLALGEPVDRLALLRATLEGIDAAYDLLWRGQKDQLRSTWEQYLAGIGEQVKIETDSGPVTGRFCGVAADGALLLERGDAGECARIERILLGDVVVGPRALASDSTN